MPSYKAPLSEMKFIAHDVFNISEHLLRLKGYEEVSEDLINAVIEECSKFCEEVLLPINQIGDEEGCKFEEGIVKTPNGFKEAYKKFSDGGWCGLTANTEFGGQGLPEVLQYFVDEIVSSTNMSFSLYPGLTQGTIMCLSTHGTESQKKLFIPNLVSGKWQGTMCLTEAQAGSDLGLIRTKAEPNQDGSFQISGTKIFISSGEHDMVENIIHLVLARTPNSPNGTQGISMFLVPKFLVDDESNLKEKNNVSAGSIEKKMGAKASATCVINFDNAKGWLIGEENKGLANMFTMMNKERLFVGTQAIGQSEISYQNASNYAKDRLQGRANNQERSDDKPADPIICHPDIRNKLLYARSIIEAERALSIWTHLNVDIAQKENNKAISQRARDIESLMTPILKSACSDFGTEITNDCLQVLGGHGYIHEWGMEQFVRDVRITQIYEGTNTIQALDLITRKVFIHNGRLFDSFIYEVEKSLERLIEINILNELIEPFNESLEYLKEITKFINNISQTDKNSLLEIANDYLKLFSLTCFSWMWLLMSEKAKELSKDKDDYYDNKLHIARYYTNKVLPQVKSLQIKIMSGSETLKISEKAFY